MDKMTYEKVGEVNSRAEGDVIESYLEAEGIDVELFEESVSHSSYAVAMARVQIFVPKEKIEQARTLLVPYHDILLEEDEDEE
jgi:hypothetical protein